MQLPVVESRIQAPHPGGIQEAQSDPGAKSSSLKGASYSFALGMGLIISVVGVGVRVRRGVGCVSPA